VFLTKRSSSFDFRHARHARCVDCLHRLVLPIFVRVASIFIRVVFPRRSPKRPRDVIQRRLVSVASQNKKRVGYVTTASAFVSSVFIAATAFVS